MVDRRLTFLLTSAVLLQSCNTGDYVSPLEKAGLLDQITPVPEAEPDGNPTAALQEHYIESAEINRQQMAEGISTVDDPDPTQNRNCAEMEDDPASNQEVFRLSQFLGGKGPMVVYQAGSYIGEWNATLSTPPESLVGTPGKITVCLGN